MDLPILRTLLQIIFLSSIVCTSIDAQFGQQFYVRWPIFNLMNFGLGTRNQVTYIKELQSGLPYNTLKQGTDPQKDIKQFNSYTQHASISSVPINRYQQPTIQDPGVEYKISGPSLPAASDPECCGQVTVFYNVAEKHGAAVTGSVNGSGIAFSQDFRDSCPNAGSQRFRTFDGTCNHPRNWGAALKPLARLLPPEYDDDKESPRRRGVDGLPLPSPRLVSTIIHKSDSSYTPFTHMFVQWGQWVDHDMTGVVTASDRRNPIKCCSPEKEMLPPPINKNCFPIELPATEAFFTGKCMEFVRSLGANDSNGVPLTPREQVNSLNAFMDGSQIYGSTSERAALIREPNSSLLRAKGDFPPENPDQGCIKRPGTNDYCFLTGDLRAHENAALAALHVIWLREHNRMAREYVKLRPNLSSDDIFQTVRRIIGALQQVITFNGYLPTVLGLDAVRLNLISNKGRSVYNANMDPRIFNAFSAAAMRFGHSSIPSGYIIGNKIVPLRELFSRPAYVLDDLEGLLLGLLGRSEFLERNSQAIDKNFVQEITQHLFEPANRTQGQGLDLVSLNLQRGRDHGLPPYTKWRAFCGLRPVYGFNDTEALGPHASELGKVYRSIHDIDLFTGMVNEPVDMGVVGPTGRCLLGIQFSRIKFGDRFFFDNDQPQSGFTDEQLQALRNMTLSKVLCQTTKLDALPLNVFKFSGPLNPLMSCEQQRAEGLDLSLF